jgi:UDP-3-O-[3-hydroxymyristoyl] glucosamine N-acyltransferase
MSQHQHTANSIAKAIGATIEGPADTPCTGVASVEEAVMGDLTFMVNAKYTKNWGTSQATIAIVPNGVSVPDHDASSRTLLWVDNADVAMSHVLSLFQADEDKPEIGIHASAFVSPDASVGEGVRIGPFVIIEKDVVISDGVCIHGNVRLGRGVSVGAHSELFSGVAIGHDCVIGKRCTLYSGVVIGTDGFGYCPSEDKSHLVKIPHIGYVVIGDEVEIGANSCVDRGKFSATTIGNGTKIDNLVQIGHNCKIGQHCVISASTGIAGSVVIGDWVQIGGNVGIVPHAVIGDGAKIGAKSGVINDIPAGEAWMGLPAAPLKDGLLQWAAVRKLPGILEQLKKKASKVE